jgi:cholest-4-en-3-one 26-monooxygenase
MSIQTNFIDSKIYAQGVPYEQFAALRRLTPVFWHAEPDGPGFWCITKHRDVIAVSRDTATYSSAQGGQIQDFPPEDPRGSPNVLANMDPPMHTVYRSIIGQSFTPRTIQQAEPFIRQSMRELLDRLVAKQQFDLMGEFCSHIPMATILHMVGVPQSDLQKIQTWVFQILARDDPQFASSQAEIDATTRAFMSYAHDLAASRRNKPQNDLLSSLMAAEVDGQRLSYEEFGMFFILLLAAGSHTTFLALGNTAFDLITHPRQRELLVKHPELISGAVEEELRFSPPITHFRRTATRSCMIGHQPIEEGQKVVMWYVSANRDEEVFERPDDFDVTRKASAHLTFGYGAHFCIGHALAKLTLRIAVEEYLTKMPKMSLVEPPERLQAAAFNGFKKMTIRV